MGHYVALLETVQHPSYLASQGRRFVSFGSRIYVWLSANDAHARCYCVTDTGATLRFPCCSRRFAEQN
jgi:hypothetical protein